jgi:hypothetical protein
VCFIAKEVLGNRIYHPISHIRYEISLFPHPRDTRSDHPIDFAAFSIIVYLVLLLKRHQIKVPLFRTIAQDATYYFLIIFTSHFVLELTLFLARVRILSQYSILLCVDC